MTPRRAPTFQQSPSRLLLDLRAADLMTAPAFVARSGQALTFARAFSGARYLDILGRYGGAVAGELRLEHLDPSTGYLPVLVLERDTTNIIQRASDFANAAWTAIGTPVLTAAAAYVGDVPLALIADDDAVNQEGYDQHPALTGDGTKTIFVILAPATQAAGGTLIRYQDSTGPTDRLNAVVKWNVDGTPNLTISAGSLVEAIPVDFGAAYAFQFAAPACVAAHTNTLRVAPCAVANQIGSVYAGNPMVVDGPWAGSPIATPASASVLRNADLLTVPIAFAPAAPQLGVSPSFTIYAKGRFAIAQGRTDVLLSIGSSALGSSDAQRGFGLLRGATGTVILRETTGAAHTDATSAAVAASSPGVHEIIAHVNSTTIDISIDGGAPVSASQAVVGSFSNQTIYLPGDNNVRWNVVKIAGKANATLADMQTLE